MGGGRGKVQIFGFGTCSHILSPTTKKHRAQWQSTVESGSEPGSDSQTHVLSTAPNNLREVRGGKRGGKATGLEALGTEMVILIAPSM